MKKIRKLQLKTATVRQLAAQDLVDVNGAGIRRTTISPATANCPSASCPEASA